MVTIAIKEGTFPYLGLLKIFNGNKDERGDQWKAWPEWKQGITVGWPQLLLPGKIGQVGCWVWGEVYEGCWKVVITGCCSLGLRVTSIPSLVPSLRCLLPSLTYCILIWSLFSDPRQWTETHVRDWVMWAVNEFSLKGVDFQKFCMDGAALCALGKECFLELAPDFVGDILWEHLEILQKGKCVKTGRRGLCGVSLRVEEKLAQQWEAHTFVYGCSTMAWMVYGDVSAIEPGTNKSSIHAVHWEFVF